MKCPECDTLYGDEIRGRLHCKECNTHLIVADHGNGKVTVTVARRTEYQHSEPSLPKAKVVRFIPDGGQATYGELRCNFCTAGVPKMVSVRGTVIIGWDKRLVPSEQAPGELIEKYIPRIREVYSCQACMSQLDSLLPDKVVNPREERFRSGRNEVRRIVKDVCGDTVVADPRPETLCETYVEMNGHCLYCGGREMDHYNYVLSTTARLERYNVR